MVPIGAFQLNLLTSQVTSTGTSWPVWRDSVTDPIKFQAIPRRQARDLWHRLRRWDRRTGLPNKHGGIIGRSSLAVYYVLTHDFLNYRTGKLIPAVKAIARAARLSERATHYCLTRLKSLGLLTWLRRCEGVYTDEGRFQLRQLSNAYHVPDHKHWPGYVNDDAPPPDRGTLGYPTNPLEPIDAAVAAIIAGNRAAAGDALLMEPDDPLARALASLGRSMGQF